MFKMPLSTVVEREDFLKTNIALGEITNFTPSLPMMLPETTSPDPENKILVTIQGISAFSTRLQSSHASLNVIIFPCVAYVLVFILARLPFSTPSVVVRFATLFLCTKTSFFNAKLASFEAIKAYISDALSYATASNGLL